MRGQLRALLRRPDLWLTAIALAIRLVPSRWHRRWPLPPREYLDFRASVYGAPLSEIPPAEFIGYLEWCRAFALASVAPPEENAP